MREGVDFHHFYVSTVLFFSVSYTLSEVDSFPPAIPFFSVGCLWKDRSSGALSPKLVKMHALLSFPVGLSGFPYGTYHLPFVLLVCGRIFVLHLCGVLVPFEHTSPQKITSLSFIIITEQALPQTYSIGWFAQATEQRKTRQLNNTETTHLLFFCSKLK